jgi:fatty acid desaturase
MSTNKEPGALTILFTWVVIGFVIWGVVALVKEYEWVGWLLQAPWALGALAYLWQIVCHPLGVMQDYANSRDNSDGA